MTGRSIKRHTCVQPVVLGLCPKRKNHPLCGWIFIISTKRFVRYSAAAARSLTKMFPECFDFVVKKTVLFEPFRNKKTVHETCTVFWWRR